jgi:hypothetical protein
MARIRYADTSRNLYVATTTTLTASSSVTALPASHSQHPDRAKVWRSVTGTGVPTMDVDLGSAQDVTCLVVANVKLVGAGALLLYSGASLGAETNLRATMPAQDRDTRTTFSFFATVNARYWRLKFTNPGSANDYAELGYVHLGTYLEPAQNVTVPVDLQRPDPSVESASVDGQQTFARRTKFFRGAWEFGNIAEAQLDNYRAMWDALGASGVFFQVLDDALPWTSWYARIAGQLAVQLAVLEGRYNVGLPWQECR